jgi:A/G-specific adenine glycosylase
LRWAWTGRSLLIPSGRKGSRGGWFHPPLLLPALPRSLNQHLSPVVVRANVNSQLRPAGGSTVQAVPRDDDDDGSSDASDAGAGAGPEAASNGATTTTTTTSASVSGAGLPPRRRRQRQQETPQAPPVPPPPREGRPLRSTRKKARAAATTTAARIHEEAPPKERPASVPSSSSSGEDDRRSLLLLQSWVGHDSVDYHRFTHDEAARIRNDLLRWYQKNRRKLPWRGDPPPWNSQLLLMEDDNDPAAATKRKRRQLPAKENLELVVHKTYPLTPYGVWVSEVMLQQTRVDTVIRYWVNFMEAFPTVRHLADASAEEVNKMWAGLGYYRRARLMHDAAKIIVKEHDGIFPNTSKKLLLLPGIGRYTANAIASISFDECVPVVDGNVCRVLARLRGIAQSIKSPTLKDRHGWELASQIVSAGGGSHPGHVNQALMEVGATYCSPSGTGIHPDDPLEPHYWSTRLGQAVFESHARSEQVPCVPPASDGSKCPVCAKGGVQQVLDNIREAASPAPSLKSSTQDGRDSAAAHDARTAGHRAFPLPPEPKLKREEVWAVAALEMPATVSADIGDEDDADHSSHECRRWLMVQRPPTGLLASQWEFPSALLWSSADQSADTAEAAKPPKKNHKKQEDSKVSSTKDRAAIPKVPSSARAQALDRLLQQVALTERDETDSPSLDRIPRMPVGDGTPLEHVFSHVRHTLWIEKGTMGGRVVDHGNGSSSSSRSRSSTKATRPPLEWRDAHGRRMRWMSSDEMASVGVTACVLKILKLVDSQVQGPSSRAAASSAPSGRARSDSSQYETGTAREKRTTQGKNERPQPGKRRKKS